MSYKTFFEVLFFYVFYVFSLTVRCEWELCSFDSNCPGGQFCMADSRSELKRCLGPRDLGTKCSDDRQCQLRDEHSECSADFEEVRMSSECQCTFFYKKDNVTRKCVVETFCRKNSDCVSKSALVNYNCKSNQCAIKLTKDFNASFITAIVLSVALIVCAILIFVSCVTKAETTTNPQPIHIERGSQSTNEAASLRSQFSTIFKPNFRSFFSDSAQD